MNYVLTLHLFARIREEARPRNLFTMLRIPTLNLFKTVMKKR